MSGLSRTPGKRVWVYPHRGFESRPLRQNIKPRLVIGGAFLFYPSIYPSIDEVLVAFYWTCPTCGRHTTITQTNVDDRSMVLDCTATESGKAVEVQAQLIECPNTSCKAQAFSVHVHHGESSENVYRHQLVKKLAPVGIGSFTFAPVTAQPLSSHVPAQVAEDYNEAYLIKSLTAKASATLARRALQGMVRDFFNVRNKGTLHAELQAIEQECDEALYAAMMAVKSVGNIGAHPEKDVNLMVDVEPGEAETLLDLIHLLDQEWYINRAERAKRIAKMQALGDSKKQAQKPAQLPPQA